MKLVLSYEISDGFTYSYMEFLPFEYGSKEQAELDLLSLWENYWKRLKEWQDKVASTQDKNQFPRLNREYPSQNLFFAGHKLEVDDLTIWSDKTSNTHNKIYSRPHIMSLDEWFETYRKNI